MNSISETYKANRPNKILMIDDDDFFGRIMQQKAAANGVNLEYSNSLEKLGRVGVLLNYDLILLDYWMSDLTGRELAEYVTAFCPDTPVVLISSDKRLLCKKLIWPACILEKICKDKGPLFILSKTIELLRQLKHT